MYYLTSIKVVTIIVTYIQITIHISTNRRKKNETCNRLCTPKYRKLQPCDFRNSKSELEGKGHEVRVRDTYELNFNPVLGASDFISFSQGNTPEDIKEEQEHISWADSITFIYPVWWAGLPAILKGYVDRVFSHGFAYAYGENGIEKLLSGKKDCYYLQWVIRKRHTQQAACLMQ